MSRIRIIGAALLALLAAIVVLQNTAEVETRFLFFSIRAPRAVLLTVTLLVGFALGTLVSLRFRASRRDP